LAETAADRADDAPQEGVGLCLSGGGYRAMLFHLGALWRLNDVGWLSRLDRVSSVSGGSIVSAKLALEWDRLDFDASGVAAGFVSRVAEPTHAFASRTVDRRAILGGLLLPGSVGGRVASAYREHLFGGATLQDLPDHPRFVINATNLQTGALWRFSKPYMADYKIGQVEQPDTELALAVAASSAFPPFLSPVRLRLPPGSMKPFQGCHLHKPPYTTRVVLSDGGVYDNLGLETVWKNFTTVLVSDGGGQMKTQPQPKTDWLLQSLRVAGVVDNQVRSLRKQQVLASYELGQREGTFWRIGGLIKSYPADSDLDCPSSCTRKLAQVRTRLRSMPRGLQNRLVNWGYAITDVAMRSWVDDHQPKAERFPYPDDGV
jgi:NTE family protein